MNIANHLVVRTKVVNHTSRKHQNHITNSFESVRLRIQVHVLGVSKALFKTGKDVLHALLYEMPSID
jgi:hypothetical protein